MIRGMVRGVVKRNTRNEGASMTTVYLLLGGTALGVALGVVGVYLSLTHSRDHDEGIWLR